MKKLNRLMTVATCVLGLFQSALFASEAQDTPPPSSEIFAPTIGSMMRMPIFSHTIVGISDDGTCVKLEDGSVWRTSSRYTLSNWQPNQKIVITTNSDWFSSQHYCLINQSKSFFNRVAADMIEFPDVFGSNSHWIIQIDQVTGHVTLENQMVWCVNPEDAHILRVWSVNDHLVLGANDSFFPHYDHILINANMYTHVRARQY